MNKNTPIIIEPLGKQHERQSFKCSIKQFEDYLQKHASQYAKRNICQTVVAVTYNNPSLILGYFTLSALSIDLSSLPGTLASKLPKHPIPAVLIGRLARDKNLDGYGIGRILLAEAYKRAASASKQLGVYAIVVDAIDEKASDFYQSFGFAKLTESNNRLFIPIKSLSL